jgi:hypothetical protein
MSYVHIQLLAVALLSVDDCRYNYQLILCNKVPNTSFFAFGFVSMMGNNVKLERRYEGNKKQDPGQAIQL